MSMGATLELRVVLENETCCVCGSHFAMPRELKRAARKDTGVWFFCPLGHRQHYKTSEADQVRADLAATERRLAAVEKSREWTEKRLENTERRLSATRGVVTKLKNRAAAGVCPCCSRTFQNLARHMSTKHPDFRDGSS